MLNQKLNQKLLQKLSPQQIQLMKLLQIPTANLEERIKEELEANPALEESDEYQDSYDNDYGDYESSPATDESYESRDEHDIDEFTPQLDDELDVSDYFNDYDDEVASYKLRDEYSNPDDDEDNYTAPPSGNQTCHEYLVEQLSMLQVDQRTLQIGNQIVGSIDEDGYLRRQLDALADDLAFGQNIITSLQELEYTLQIIQDFDPPGVGARDLQECLLIQLRRKNPANNPAISIAEKILLDHFDEFAKKHYDKLIRNMGITNDDLKAAIDEILKLNPKPGGTHEVSGKVDHNYIIPDFIITNQNGRLVVSLNSKNAPELRISDTYRDMLREYSLSKHKSRSQKDAIMFIKQKIDAAKWFIDAIKQRQSTMEKTMQAILGYQYEYFLTGDELKLRPMILRDVAELTDLDISTVSRVANSKYVQTEFGIFRLKDFFSESMQTESGEEVSTREIKKILTELISAEDKTKPLSDERLMNDLLERGYNIARRTVAKYREQLDIPVARLRREL